MHSVSECPKFLNFNLNTCVNYVLDKPINNSVLLNLLLTGEDQTHGYHLQEMMQAKGSPIQDRVGIL